MIPFKFLDRNEIHLNNYRTSIITFSTSDGYNMARSIDWSNFLPVNNGEYRFNRFVGNMEQFFRWYGQNRVPVINDIWYNQLCFNGDSWADRANIQHLFFTSEMLVRINFYEYINEGQEY